MIVVVDSTPLIYLGAIGRFDLLRSLYGRILIPFAVFDEVVNQGEGRWGARETAAADWVDVKSVSDPTFAADPVWRTARGSVPVALAGETQPPKCFKVGCQRMVFRCDQMGVRVPFVVV